MSARTAPVLLALLLALAGCGPRFVRPGAGPAVDPAPWVRALEEYNRGPRQLRLAGVFRSGAWGRARFGAAVAEGAGVRVDAVAGPFGTTAFVLACRDDRCRVYVPSERRAVELDTGGAWLARVLLGRVPTMGPARAAWRTPDGGTVLLLGGPGGWTQEVEWGPEGRRPRRARFVRQGRVEAEISWEGRVAGVRFWYPARIGLKLREPSADYEMELTRVAPADGLEPDLFVLRLPPGVTVERAEGTEGWKPSRVPLLHRMPPG